MNKRYFFYTAKEPAIFKVKTASEMEGYLMIEKEEALPGNFKSSV